MAAPRPSAGEALQRILQILPLAARRGGAALDELAAALEVPVERIVEDLAEVTAREYYRLPPLDIDILIEGDRVEVWTTGEFRRPVRLSPLEALTVALGLRILAEEAGGEREERRRELRALAHRLDHAIASAPSEPLAASYALDGGDASGQGLLALLKEAAAARRPCRLLYLKPGGEGPEVRLVHPYTLIFGSGNWYVVGRSEEAAEVRVFRIDRIAEARVLAGRFEIPDDFDPEAYVTGGAVYRADEEVEVSVRYSPKVARFVLERIAGRGAGDGADRSAPETRPDGSIVVRHRVADPLWVVRHVLSFGAEARILDPPEIVSLLEDRLDSMM